MPSFSSARGDRVVTETESRIGPGESASKRRTSVDLPLPEGPDITIKGPRVMVECLGPARRSLHILNQLAYLLERVLDRHHVLGNADVARLRANGIGFAEHF